MKKSILAILAAMAAASAAMADTALYFNGSTYIDMGCYECTSPFATLLLLQ